MQSSTYVYSSSLYHRFDTRAKLIFTLLMCICPFLRMPLYLYYSLTLFVVALSLYSVGLKVTLNSFKLILSVLIFMVLFSPLQERSGDALICINDFVLITKEGAIYTQILINRFIFISILCSLLLQTSTNRDLILSLRFFHLPYSACLVLSLSLRFIPSFATIFSQIKDSQRLRLPNPEEEIKGKGSIKKLIPTFTSALVVALKSINTTAAALDLRGFDRKIERTSYYALEKNLLFFTQLLLGAIMPLIFIIVVEVVL